MDLAITWDVCTNVLQAATALGITDAVTARIREALPRLRPVPHRRQRRAAGMGRGSAAAGSAPSSPLAPVRPASRSADHADIVGRVVHGGTQGARTPRRRRDRLVARVEGQRVGTTARRRPCASAARPAAAPRRRHRRAHEWRRWRLRQPVRRAPTVPDRRQLRRDVRHLRDAAAEPRRRPRPAAGAAGRVAARSRDRPACARRLRRGSRVGRRPTVRRAHPIEARRHLSRADRRRGHGRGRQRRDRRPAQVPTRSMPCTLSPSRCGHRASRCRRCRRGPCTRSTSTPVLATSSRSRHSASTSAHRSRDLTCRHALRSGPLYQRVGPRLAIRRRAGQPSTPAQDRAVIVRTRKALLRVGNPASSLATARSLILSEVPSGCRRGAAARRSDSEPRRLRSVCWRRAVPLPGGIMMTRRAYRGMGLLAALSLATTPLFAQAPAVSDARASDHAIGRNATR